MIIKGIKRIVFLLICLFFFYTAGCVIHAKEISLSRKFSVGEIGKINIQTLFEDVKVTAGPDDMIYLDYYGKAATSRNAEEILKISREENLLSLESNWSGDDKNWSLLSLGVSNVVNLDIRVPAGLLGSLDIESTSGDVRVSGLNLKKSLSINVMSGSLNLIDISTGNTRLKTISGNINGTNIQNWDTSSMRTVSGNIYVAFNEPGLKITGISTSGNISLRLPADQGFTLAAKTISGRIRNYFSSSRNGEGAPPSINLETVSGDIKIYH